MELSIKNNQNTTELLNYLKNSDTQYKTLNKEEERKLIEQHKDNRDELNRLLFMHNIRAVFNEAKKYVHKTQDFDSLVQDGMRGLAEAATRFDTSKNIKFITYATCWIRKYILANFYGKQVELDKRSTSLNVASPSANMKSNNGTEVTMEDYVNEIIEPTCKNQLSVIQQIDNKEQSELCKALMCNLENDTSLSATDKAIFIDIIYNKEKTTDLALKYQTERSHIFEVKNKILAKFKSILATQYDIKSFQDI